MMLSWLSSSPNYAAAVCAVAAPVIFLSLLGALSLFAVVAENLILNRPSED